MLSEQQLEAYICEHPHEVLPGLSIIKRQAFIPHGVADIIGWQDYQLGDLGIARPVVIELKVVPMRPKDIAQLLRYCYDIEALLCQSEVITFEGDMEWELAPLMVCPAWTQYAMAACGYTGVAVVHWYHNKMGQLEFEHIEPWFDCSAPYWQQPPPWFRELVSHIEESQNYAESNHQGEHLHI